MAKNKINAAIEILNDVLSGLDASDPGEPLDREYISGSLSDPIEDIGDVRVLGVGTPAMQAWDNYMMTWNDQADPRSAAYKQQFIEAARSLLDALVALRGPRA